MSLGAISVRTNHHTSLSIIIFNKDLTITEKMEALKHENNRSDADVGVFGEVILETLDKNGKLKPNQKINHSLKL